MTLKTKNIFSQAWFYGALLAGLMVSMAAGQFFVTKILFPKNEILSVYGEIPAFSLKDQTGQDFGSTDLQGRVWIADFIFTRCMGPCPLMSFQMEKLQKSLSENPRIKFVSFSVDPEHDAPEVLSEYAKRFNADPKRWHFLTGDRAVIHQLAKESFHLAVSPVSPEDQDAAFSLSHSTKFVLIDGAGKIRGFYDGQGQSPLDNLIRDAKLLVKQVKSTSLK
ncbi:MAG: SCO family protein [Candidatus Omnitrophica bacterium]|nr:SCO family protein [Candidatus Omnitrophota bacterium]